MTSRSWQYINSCHWDACSNHSAISHILCQTQNHSKWKSLLEVTRSPFDSPMSQVTPALVQRKRYGAQTAVGNNHSKSYWRDTLIIAPCLITLLFNQVPTVAERKVWSSSVMWTVCLKYIRKRKTTQIPLSGNNPLNLVCCLNHRNKYSTALKLLPQTFIKQITPKICSPLRTETAACVVAGCCRWSFCSCSTVIPRD